MNHGEGGPWKGQGANLEAAFNDAWNQAKNAGAPAGEYDVKIKIEATNPIHAYIVVLTPPGD